MLKKGFYILGPQWAINHKKIRLFILSWLHSTHVGSSVARIRRQIRTGHVANSDCAARSVFLPARRALACLLGQASAVVRRLPASIAPTVTA